MTKSEYTHDYQLVLNDLNRNKLKQAIILAEELEIMCESTLRNYQIENNELLANEWLLRRLSVSFIKNYIEYFECLKNKDYRKSWDVLQSCRMRLVPLNNYRNIYQIIELDYLASRLECFEKLYPFTMFLSIGAKFKKITCSICNNDVRSLECTHIMGKLYNGRIATRLLDEGTILEVSIVDKPYDRCCVAEPKGGYSDTWKKVFEQLNKIEGLITLEFSIIEYIKEKNGENLIDPTMKCYCNSGRTFINCCWKEVQINNRYLHIEIEGYRDLKTNYNTA